MIAWATYPILRCLEAPEQVPRLEADTSHLPDLYLAWNCTTGRGCARHLSSGTPLGRLDGRWSWAELVRQTHEWPSLHDPERPARQGEPHSRRPRLRKLCPPARRCGGRCR